jgi:hypothetical protein
MWAQIWKCNVRDYPVKTDNRGGGHQEDQGWRLAWAKTLSLPVAEYGGAGKHK